MKGFTKLSVLIVSVFCNSSFLAAQSISVRNPQQAFKEVSFAYQYGTDVFIYSKSFLDENGFTFINNESLHSGLYYIIFSDSTSIEFLYDSLYPGKVSIEKNNNELKLSGPLISEAYFNYKKSLSTIDYSENVSNKKSSGLE